MQNLDPRPYSPSWWKQQEDEERFQKWLQLVKIHESIDRLKANSVHSLDSGLVAKVHYAIDLLENDLNNVTHATSGYLASMQDAKLMN